LDEGIDKICFWNKTDAVNIISYIRVMEGPVFIIFVELDKFWM